MSFVNFLEGALKTFDLADDINRIIIDRTVNRVRSRPHPWSTRNNYISWTGLTDRSYNARLLPAVPGPAIEGIGTSRPPIAAVAALFAVPAGKTQRMCRKSTALFPAFAQYLTDGFIRTMLSNDDTLTDRKRTTSNHEIDMSPLYGRTQAQTAVLRIANAPKGKFGQLKTQTIKSEAYPPALFGPEGHVKAEFCDAAGRPVLDMPLGLKNVSPQGKANLFAVGGDRVNAAPQTAMINTLFLREHNRLAAMLEKANTAWDSDRVFETARNIIIVMFIKIVIEEYINHINSTEFSLVADPSGCWKAQWNRPNWMTVEFSLLYRWHALVAETATWGGQTLPGNAVLLNTLPLTNGGLAKAFVDVSAGPATRLGLENSASFLEKAESDAIGQARHNNVASYNSYRQALAMKRADSFAAIVGATDDPVEKVRRDALALRLQGLYGKPDNVEFYVGLFAEAPEKNGPLPELISAMVAMDAFSQALTNPLLSEHIWGNPANKQLAFTDAGIRLIEATGTLKDVLVRNTVGGVTGFVGMTRQDFKFR